MTQTDIFRDPTLPAYVKLVYTALAHYADDKRDAFPSHTTLAQDTGISVRAVGTALRQAEAAGLVDVVHTQTSNRYQLRDLKVGGYVLGSGPLGTTCHPGRHVVPSGTAPRADEQDKVTRPVSKTTSTSGDAYAASGQRTSSQTDRKIILPERFDELAEDGDVIHTLMKCATAAIRDAGLVLHNRARPSLVEALKTVLKEGHDRYYAAERLRYWINRAGTDDPGCGWLASWPDAA